MSGKPVLTLVTYEARPGAEEQLAGLLRTHVARLRELGLVAERPAFAAARPDKPGTFVESFWWVNEGAQEMARDHVEVQELWMRVEDLCVPEGVKAVVLDLLD
jgi:hypothetical protein